jgi:retron-type reverse transcriptase
MKKWYSLIDKIYRKENLIEAFKRVKRNNGAPGIDGETVEDYTENIEKNTELLHEKLKTETYEPSPVRRVEIQKPDGGTRLLGVPNVKDRVVQQAIVNVIEPIFDATFHPYLYLNKFDQRMMSKGVRIVRYADDILIFAKSKQEAGNYLKYATKVLEEELKLKVNTKKTKLTSAQEGVEFLGFKICSSRLGINPKRVKRFKDKVRKVTKRGSGRPIETVIKELNPILRGWMNYYRIANIKKLTKELMQWVRRRLRMIRMKQWKTYKKMHKEMRRLGIKGNGKKMDVCRWKNSTTQMIHLIMPNKYFEKLGLIDLCTYKVGLLSNYY